MTGTYVTPRLIDTHGNLPAAAPLNHVAIVADDDGSGHGQLYRGTGSAWVAFVFSSLTVSTFGAGVVHSSAGGVLSSSLIVNADITDATINLAKLAQSGASSGQVATWSGSAWVPGSAGGGGTITGVTAGAGLTGGGSSGAIVLDVGQNADGSIVVNANDIQVGVLATDAQHGVRGGGTQHATVTNAAAGFAPNITAANRVLLSTSGTAAVWGQVDLATAQITGVLPTTAFALGGANQVFWSNGSANSWTGSPILSTSLSIGTAPSTFGAIRLSTNTGIYSRNSANSFNIIVITTDSLDRVQIGSSAAAVQVATIGAGVVHSDASGTLSASLIVDANIANATITTAKIAPGTNGQVFITNATPAVAWVTPSGDWVGAVTANTIHRITGSGGVVAIGATDFVWDSNADHPTLSQNVATSGSGVNFDVLPQWGFQTGDTVGGAFRVFGGKGHGTGASGGFQFGIGGLGGSTMLIGREVATAGHRVLGICGDANDTDASSGADLYAHWHDAAAIPSVSARPGNGGFLWESVGRFFHRGKHGLSTTIAGDGPPSTGKPTYKHVAYGNTSTSISTATALSFDVTTITGSVTFSYTVVVKLTALDIVFDLVSTIVLTQGGFHLASGGSAMTSTDTVNLSGGVASALCSMDTAGVFTVTVSTNAGGNFDWFAEAEFLILEH